MVTDAVETGIDGVLFIEGGDHHGKFKRVLQGPGSAATGL
jgi:hypothetical protein